MLKNMCFLNIDFLVFFFSIFKDFGSILGGQKSSKNRKKTQKIDFGMGSVFKEASERVLGGFWETFGRILEGFWKDFGSFWGGF